MAAFFWCDEPEFVELVRTLPESDIAAKCVWVFGRIFDKWRDGGDGRQEMADERCLVLLLP
jgi:hypothetical protein